MPVQEPGTKRARPLPCQPGAGLAGFTPTGGAVTAQLELSNNAPFVSRASHCAVYDITVIGPNRFLRRFTGDLAGAGATARVAASYYRRGAGQPALTFTLANDGTAGVSFTVTTNNYASDEPVTYDVPTGGSADHCVDPVRDSGGWYDLTVTIDSDRSWSQRFTGHLETGAASVTG